MLTAANFLKQAGWPEENMFVYMLDESHAWPAVRNLTMRIKQLLPAAKTVGCGDNAFPFEAGTDWPCTKNGPCMNVSELEPGGILEFVDILIPRMATDANQTADHLAAV